MKSRGEKIIGKREKKAARAVLLLAGASALLLLSGCRESKSAREARLSGIEKLKEENYSEAILSFETALQEADGIVDEFELDILKYRGEAEYRLGDFSAAAHTYDILAEVDGEKPEYLYLLAAAEAGAGNLDDAEAAFLRAVEADGGETLTAAGDGEEAAETPGASLALAALSKGLRENGEAERALSLCQSALERGGADPELYNQMGLSFLALERYEEAQNAFQQGLSFAQGEKAAQLQYNLGAVREKMGDFAGALEIFAEYVEAYGSTPELEKEIAFLKTR